MQDHLASRQRVFYQLYQLTPLAPGPGSEADWKPDHPATRLMLTNLQGSGYGRK